MEVIVYICQQFYLLAKKCFSIFHIEEFAATKGIIRIRQSKDMQRYGKMKKHQPRSTKHTHKITNRVTWTPLKPGGVLRCSGSYQSKVKDKAFYSKSVQGSNIQRKLWNFLLPIITQITYKNQEYKHTRFTNTLYTIQHSTLWQVTWQCLIIFCHAIQNRYSQTCPYSHLY